MTIDKCEELRRKVVLGTVYTKEMKKLLPLGTVNDMEQKLWFKPTDDWYKDKWKEFTNNYNHIMSLGHKEVELRKILREKGIRISLIREYDNKCKK